MDWVYRPAVIPAKTSIRGAIIANEKMLPDSTPKTDYMLDKRPVNQEKYIEQRPQMGDQYSGTREKFSRNYDYARGTRALRTSRLNRGFQSLTNRNDQTPKTYGNILIHRNDYD